MYVSVAAPGHANMYGGLEKRKQKGGYGPSSARGRRPSVMRQKTLVQAPEDAAQQMVCGRLAMVCEHACMQTNVPFVLSPVSAVLVATESSKRRKKS